MSIKRLTKHAKDKPMVETITEPTQDDLYELFVDDDIVSVINQGNSMITIGPGEIEMNGMIVGKLPIFQKLEQWFIAKGLDKADPKKQFEKLLEEVDEVKEALQSGDIEHIQEELADIVIVVQGLMLQHNLDFMESLQKGFNKIENRTGEIVDGTFVQTHKLPKLTPKKDGD